MAAAGFMFNLRKCKFCTPRAVVLGRELLYYGYRLSSKFLASCVGLQIPCTLAQLQSLLGKLLYCSAHIPNYKQLVTPLEQLLSPCTEAIWTMECTQSPNMLLKWVFKHVHMQQPSAGASFDSTPTWATGLAQWLWSKYFQNRIRGG